jgi:putative hydrolase of the HAD superfamily
VLTGILSNSFVGAREREQDAFGFEELVDVIVYSHEVGRRKPDPEIYAITCSRLGVEPHEVLFVDDVQENVDGAIAAGMDAIRFVDAEQAIAEIEARLVSPAAGAT